MEKGLKICVAERDETGLFTAACRLETHGNTRCRGIPSYGGGGPWLPVATASVSFESRSGSRPWGCRQPAVGLPVVVRGAAGSRPWGCRQPEDWVTLRKKIFFCFVVFNTSFWTSLHLFSNFFFSLFHTKSWYLRGGFLFLGAGGGSKGLRYLAILPNLFLIFSFRIFSDGEWF